jgi:TPP-dependent indolepyruvate ferredoxin oxidoreductase alpha subunit
MDIHVRQYWYPDANGVPALKVYKFFRKVGPRKYELIPELMSYGFASKARAEKRAREVEAEYAAKEAAEAAKQEFVCSGCLDGWCDGCVPETEM